MTGAPIAAEKLSYVLVTPARNEEAFIERTIQSVASQSVIPRRWVIVSDGSTDRTNEIVSAHAAVHRWMTLVALPPRKDRHFAAKARAFHAGVNALGDLRYDIIGNLDADISFEADYIQRLLAKFAEDERLGVAGSPFREGGVQYDSRFSRKDHVSGACQLFRRECFDAIGGYVPQPIGGIDVVAVVSARMHGWRTETFTDQCCVHLRPMGSANDRFVSRLFKSGYGDYCLGVHPAWQLCRSIYQMSRKPLVAAGALLLAGYVWAYVTRASKPVSPVFVRFRRREQRQWLSAYVKAWCGLERRSTIARAEAAVKR